MASSSSSGSHSQSHVGLGCSHLKAAPGRADLLPGWRLSGTDTLVLAGAGGRGRGLSPVHVELSRGWLTPWRLASLELVIQ